ncbi:MAG TPA: tRNA pseudouridine(38-40) synthase TruA [bacterium]
MISCDGMMRNLKLVITYDGTDFHGWQYQPNARTIQGEVEAALLRVTGEPAKLHGAGRTDQGVHAQGQIANFKTNSSMPVSDLCRALNALVGKSIVIADIAEVSPDFHSRFSAVGKVYQYHIIFKPSPFLARYAWHVTYSLELPAMDRVFKRLQGKHDFVHLSVHNGDDTGTVCVLNELNLTEHDSGIIIKIKADRFLRKMIRGIIGFAVDVSRGHYSVADTEKVFQGQITDLYFAPPHGLCLMEVIY